jgi:hypothetical protein
VPVYVGYLAPPVQVILAGYPADRVDPLTYVIDIVQIGVDTDNPHIGLHRESEGSIVSFEDTG